MVQSGTTDLADRTAIGSPRPVDISVLVPTRERPDLLLACLTSILANDHPSFEVIVIDQSAEPYDKTQNPRLRVLRSRAQGKSAALNEGMAQAQGRLFAFTDDDCTVPPDWLTQGQSQLESHPDVALVYGALLAIPHDPSEYFVPAFKPTRLETVSGARRARLRGGAGANIFARREIFERIGGWDDAIGPGAPFRSCEEYDIYFRALRAGATVLRDPSNGVLHWGARSYADGSGQRLIRGYDYGEGAVLGKHVRSGDLTALWLVAGILWEQAREIGSSLFEGRRPRLARVAYWLAGFGRGLLTPVNRARRLFAIRTA